LHQRSANKYHSANLWSNTCCGHPHPEEDTLSAAKRRLNEEMGINADITEIGAFHYRANLGNGLTEHEIDHVFIGKIDDGNLVHFNPDEVQNYRWIKLTTLEDELSLHPENYTTWLKPALDVLLQCNL
jgi:isopentenyl-diphosphate Delta-isomerase